MLSRLIQQLHLAYLRCRFKAVKFLSVKLEISDGIFAEITFSCNDFHWVFVYPHVRSKEYIIKKFCIVQETVWCDHTLPVIEICGAPPFPWIPLVQNLELVEKFRVKYIY